MVIRKLITAGLLLAIMCLSADKIPVRINTEIEQIKHNVHPLQKYFEKPVTSSERAVRNRAVDNKLLVMLIDFQTDDNPATTGNGKFIYDAGDYPLDIGKPPHDQEYFWWILESVRYYYQAASLNAYNLEFDIYPQYNYTESDTAVAAYTLPNEMAYYNPPGASTELMISRFEEYFHDVFTVADQDADVDFASYGHYMILHAGSDSQHDIRGDSQGDIPSFFIRVGDGKEVYVDDGFMINYACNVPETISQDDQYGVTNAVIAHEFGHSLGFVDLYSTLTGGPQVGWYDIMDSGGMGELVTESNGEIYNIEGGLPSLPSAWHRILVWEDYFREHGLLKDIDELNWSDEIRIDPAEKLYSGGDADFPRFIKVPLTEKEYLLIENRQVDPDGDGGLSFKGALAQYPSEDYKGYRILLYPTYPGYDSPDTPNWEYDLFLPGWQREEPEEILNFGGGILIWHIDDRIIYETGEYYEGEFQSNYDMNTVNALHTDRGVKIIEADGFDNIGNYNDSYNILGSAWDPFYLYQPSLDGNGEFLRWADQGIPGNYELHNEDEFVHVVEFNGNSNPALTSNDGDPSLFGFYDFSSYSIIKNQERYMSFKYGTHVFDEIETLKQYEDLSFISGVGKMYSFPSIAVFADEKIELMQKIGSDWGDYLQYSFEWNNDITQPIQNYDLNGDGNDEFSLVSGNEHWIISENNIHLENEFNTDFSDAPVFLENGDIVYPLVESLLINDDQIAFPGAKIAASQEMILARNHENIAYIDIDTGSITQQYELRSENMIHAPLLFNDLDTDEITGYTVSEDGIVYKITEQELIPIFYSSDYTTSIPSQLMLSPLEKKVGITRIVFAAGEKLFALSLDGSIIKGFPVLLEDKSVAEGSYLKSLLINDEIILMLKRESGGILAVDNKGCFRQEYSSVLSESGLEPVFWYDSENQSLNWFSGRDNKTLYHAVLNVDEDNPLVFSGWRAGVNGLITGKSSVNMISNLHFSAYAYPNPARDGYFRIRIEGAEEDINLKLYDIAGNLVRSKNAALEDSEYQDIRIESEGLASGVYYVRLKSASKMLTTAVGIIQ